MNGRSRDSWPEAFALAAVVFVLAALAQAVWMRPLRAPPAPRLQGSPRRIVIFPPALWTVVTLEQGVGQVAGITNYLRRNAREGLLDAIYPDLDRVSMVATRGSLSAIPASAEDVLRLAPDLVVTWKWFAQPLRAAGLPLLELTTDRKSERASMLRQWHAIAAATGHEARERLLAARYWKELASIAQENAGAPRPSALVISRLPAGTFLSDARENLAVAGGTRPPGLPSAGRLSDEELLRIDPEFIFLRCCAPGDTPDAVYAEKNLAPMTAIKRRHVYLEPSGSFRMEGLVQEPLLDRWMAELLHRRHTSSLLVHFYDAYKKYYSFILDRSQLEQILHFEQNRKSNEFF